MTATESNTTTALANLSQINVDVRLLTQPQGKMIGLATVEYHGFKMDGFKVFNGEKGLFLGEPTVRDGRTNNFVKTIRVTGDELREVEFASTDELERFCQTGFEISLVKKEANQVHVVFYDKDANRFLAELSNYQVNFFSEIKFTLEDHFMKFYGNEGESHV